MLDNMSEWFREVPIGVLVTNHLPPVWRSMSAKFVITAFAWGVNIYRGNEYVYLEYSTAFIYEIDSP